MKKPIIGVYLKCCVPLTAVVIKDETQKSKEMEKYYNKKKDLISLSNLTFLVIAFTFLIII